MKVLLVGGTGHIGGRLARHLAEQSIDVAVTSRRAGPIDERARAIPVVSVADIEATKWEEVISDYSHVVHLVSPREKECNDNHDLARQVVETGSARLGQAVALVGNRLVYLSTAQVYGPKPTGRLTEKSPPVPGNVYAAVHLAAESVLRDTCGSALTIVRLANSVGLPVHPSIDTWQLLVHDLAREVAQNGTLTLRSSGLQHRSFVAVSEVIDALVQLMKSDASLATVNFANHRSQSVLSMAKRIGRLHSKLTGSESILRAPDPSDDEVENPFELVNESPAATGLSLGDEAQIDSEIIRIMAETARTK